MKAPVWLIVLLLSSPSAFCMNPRCVDEVTSFDARQGMNAADAAWYARSICSDENGSAARAVMRYLDERAKSAEKQAYFEKVLANGQNVLTVMSTDDTEIKTLSEQLYSDCVSGRPKPLTPECVASYSRAKNRLSAMVARSKAVLESAQAIPELAKSTALLTDHVTQLATVLNSLNAKRPKP